MTKPPTSSAEEWREEMRRKAPYCDSGYMEDSWEEKEDRNKFSDYDRYISVSDAIKITEKALEKQENYQKKYQKIYQTKNKGKIKKYYKKYYQKNRIEINKKRKKIRQSKKNDN